MKDQYKVASHYDNTPQLYPELKSDKNSSLTCATFQQFCSLYTSQTGVIVDIGCGTGRVGRYLERTLRPQLNAICYLDISNKELLLAKSLGSDAVKRLFVRGDVLDLPLSGIRFCSCHGVIHHTPDPGKALEQLAIALSAGSIMYLAVYKYSWVTPLYKMLVIVRYFRKIGLEFLVTLVFILYFIPRFSLRVLETGSFKTCFNIRASFEDFVMTPFAYYFTDDEMRSMFENVGLKVESYEVLNYNTLHCYVLNKQG